jgi:hypothetical protein
MIIKVLSHLMQQMPLYSKSYVWQILFCRLANAPVVITSVINLQVCVCVCVLDNATQYKVACGNALRHKNASFTKCLALRFGWLLC